MRVLWFINNPLGLRGGLQCILRESYEFVIPKGVIHLSEKFVREA